MQNKKHNIKNMFFFTTMPTTDSRQTTGSRLISPSAYRTTGLYRPSTTRQLTLTLILTITLATEFLLLQVDGVKGGRESKSKQIHDTFVCSDWSQPRRIPSSSPNLINSLCCCHCQSQIARLQYSRTQSHVCTVVKASKCCHTTIINATLSSL